MKIKASILTRIAVLLLAALILSSVITFAFSYRHILNTTAQQGEAMARAAATAAMTAIGSKENLYALYEDEGFREEMHKTFRYICSRNDLRYLYLYTVDEKGYKHYVICAAQSDEDDERLQTEYGFGAVREEPLYQAEINVLSGNGEDDFEFINNEYGWVCMYIQPIRSDDEIIALIGIDDTIDEVRRTAARSLVNLLMLSMIIFALTYIIALALIRRSVIRPILALSKRMQSFVRDRRENIETGRRRTVYEDEITDMERSFDKMTEDIAQYVRDIEKLTGEQVYNQTQLEVARNIQSGIVPREYALSDDGFAVYGCVQAAREVGGDFYDVFRLKDGQLCAVVGDISGKGISAALFMSMVKTTIRENLMSGRGLADTLNLVNRELCASNPENMFATVFSLLLDTESGVVTYANAGHEAPLLLCGAPFYLEIRSGMALGLFEDAVITEEKLALRDGDGILLYTDGVTEAVNTARRQYGKDRLRETARRAYREASSSWDPRLLVGAATASVSGFAGEAEQFDDITCLALVYRAAGSRRMLLAPALPSFDAVRDVTLSALGESEHTKGIVLACEEIFVNIVRYAGAKQVRFTGRRCGELWLAVFEDDGVAFDPVKAELKSVEFETLDQGGMGILFARANSRDMIYSRIDGSNVLAMVFDADDRRS